MFVEGKHTRPVSLTSSVKNESFLFPNRDIYKLAFESITTGNSFSLPLI